MKENDNTENGKEPKKCKSSCGWMLGSAVLGLILIWFATPPIFNALTQGQLIRATHNLKQMGSGLIEYEDQNEKFPPLLEDIFNDEFLGQLTLDECFERTSKMKGLWWYNVGIAELGFNAPHDSVHLVSPSIDGKCAILRVDQRLHQMTDEEAMRIITEADSTWRPIMGTYPKD